MAMGHTVDYRISDRDENVHVGVWDNSLDPVRTVEPGSVVRFECRDATDNHFDAESTVEEMATKPSGGHPLTGPIRVDGAEPGDVLAVELLEFQHKGFGVSYFYSRDTDKGLLPESFEEPGLHTWELDGDVGRFVNGIEIPLEPFPGIVGVAPAEPGEHSTIPPRRVGGNMDIKHLTAGSTLYLPVEVEGALFSIGDCHAAQGDGEVCVTAIEAPMSVTARLDVRSDMAIEEPQFETTGPFTATGADEPAYATTGIADDLMDATKRAIRHMIDHLSETHGLTRAEAYILCSVAVDLKINQVVDAPNWTVSAYLPESIFPDEEGESADQ
ncbi:acetamidase/formamidase family protein [Natronomonas sp. F2-12]|jgi:acetamidase/formamidase|uniref:Acetamidase/formamidase family protein n=1 Tax=Natronomonas aquatica TaxID=2841590 RepID=A0A9R1D552_9EURY|nr:acetamidase/formamidase family protein [Natronomonas aquatica]MCQ4332008.1 acetamidase/formamidase family protein [Natronomonas aquatica]